MSNICPFCNQCVHCEHPSWPCPEAPGPTVNLIDIELEKYVKAWNENLWEGMFRKKVE